MKPNERFGAQIVFIFCILAVFIVGAIAYSTGVEHGYDGKIPYTRINYDIENEYSIDLLDNDYLIDSKKLEGGTKDGNKYWNSNAKPEKLGTTNKYKNGTYTESDKYNKQKFKENIQDLGRFFQNSWYIGTALAGSYYFPNN